MKRIFSVLMVLVLGGWANGIIMKAGETSPSIKFVMRTSAGVPVTGLVGTNFTIYYAEHHIDTSGLGDEVTVNCTNIADPDDAYDDNGAVEIGHGVYRLDLPAAAVDGAAGTYVSVCITDETAAALNTYVLIELTPSVNTVLANGTTMATTSTLVAAIWDDLLPGTHADGTAGEIVGNSIADIWNSLWSSYTTNNSFGRMFKTMYDKVMKLR